MLADNKLAVNAGWDEDLLAAELGELLNEAVTFDLDVTGFSIAEADLLIEGQKPEEPGDPKDDALPVRGEGASCGRVQAGDIWRLGPHRLSCADALDTEAVAALMHGDLAQMVFCDPPYNVPIAGNVGGLGAIKHSDFAMAAGEMSTTRFSGFLRGAFENLVKFSVDGSIHFICMDWRHLNEILVARAVFRAQELDCLGQGQRRDGDVLPLPT